MEELEGDAAETTLIHKLIDSVIKRNKVTQFVYFQTQSKFNRQLHTICVFIISGVNLQFRLKLLKSAINAHLPLIFNIFTVNTTTKLRK